MQTSAKRGASHALLYRDTGTERLQKRRDRSKLTIMYKIKDGMCQELMEQVKPQRPRERTVFGLRKASNTSLFKTRTKTMYES